MQHLETCLLIAEADGVLCHLVMFLSVFFHAMYKMIDEIQLLTRFVCYSWLVCRLGFWLRNAPLVKVIGNPTADCKRVEKPQAILTLLDGLQELHLDW